MLLSADSTCRSSNLPPNRSESLTSSGSDTDRPPAPTSWIMAMGLSLPKATRRMDVSICLPT